MSNEPNKTQIDPGHGDQGGEGNYDASRRYREGVKRTVEGGRTEELAEEAKEALEGDEREDLERAEQAGKEAQIPTKH